MYACAFNFEIKFWCKVKEYFRNCKHCGDSFNINSSEKIRAGGYINECPDCVDERGGDNSPPKYLGVTAGDGKMADVTILAFDDEKSRDAYKKMWKANSGQNKGKSCQIGTGMVHTGGLKFHKVAENRANGNHKGKL